MLALQGTLTVPSFYGVSSSMDEHAPESGHASPSGSMGWRTRAQTSRYRPQLPPERADLGSAGLSGVFHSKASCLAHVDFYNAEHSQIGAHPSRPSSAHPAYHQHEH